MPPALLPVAVYATALAMTLVLANYTTPGRWWRRPTLRGLGILVGGTWAIGALLLLLLASPPARAPLAASPLSAVSRPGKPLPSLPASPSAPLAGQTYRVHRDLNVRLAAATGAPRLTTVPAGATVIATGAHAGDWWQVSVAAAGSQQTGWASSLWLRRQDE
jgi:hypothetical protein